MKNAGRLDQYQLIVEFYWICEACGANPDREALKIMKAFAKL